MPIELESPAFGDGDTIPPQYTGKGDDVSPPLEWSDPPEGTRSFALVVDDPDAPGEKNFVHWVAYDIPADQRSLPEHVPPEPSREDGMRQGRNDFGKIGYGGPLPPPGKIHHYNFQLYALDSVPNLEPGATKEDLLAHAHQHVLDQGQLTGTYAVDY